MSSIGMFPVGASFLIAVETMKSLVDNVQNPECFMGAFLKKELFSVLDQLRP